MKIKVKEKFVDSISGKKIYANKAENTTNGLNIDDSISSLSSTIKTKQNKLTFAGEDNTITAINSSAIKVDLTDYYTKNETSGKDEISTALETKAYAIARVGGGGPLFGENMKFKFAPEGGTNLNLQEYDSSIDAWTDIGVIVTKENKGPNKILKTDNRNILQWIDPDYYTKSETSAASSISAALDGKEDKLTFGYSDSNITAINNSAVGGGTEYTAGTDISIINGVIKVSTNGEKIGNLSFVEGCMTTAVGSASHAEGRATSAVGEESHAEGSGTSAIGRYSHSEGRISLASGQYSHAEGDNTSALNVWGHAEGERTLASGAGDHAEGHMTSAIGRFSHAEGWQTIASGYYQQQGGAWAGGFAHSEGDRTSALGEASHAEGYKTLALATRTHAEGEATSAVGINTHAEGTQTSAVNQDAHAECYQTSAIGYGSHSEGCRTKASGNYSHAEGENAIASGKDSHAGGCYTTAQGNYSYTEGYYTLANGSASHAEGAYTQTNSPNMHAQGTWNKTTENVAFVIGNGLNANNKSDAFIVDWNGTASATKLATSGITDIEATINSLASVGGYAVVASTASITNPDTKTIYLVKDTTVTGDDQYKEYICTNTATPTYEMIGDTSIDLTPYLTKTSADVDYQPKGDYVPLATYNTLTAKVQELETLLNTYSGFWVLTNQPTNNG